MIFWGIFSLIFLVTGSCVFLFTDSNFMGIFIVLMSMNIRLWMQDV